MECYLQRRVLVYCIAAGEMLNVLFKTTVNSMLINVQKAEGSFGIGKCVFSAGDLLRGLATPGQSGVRQGEQVGTLDSHRTFRYAGLTKLGKSSKAATSNYNRIISCFEPSSVQHSCALQAGTDCTCCKLFPRVENAEFSYPHPSSPRRADSSGRAALLVCIWSAAWEHVAWNPRQSL